MHAVPHAPVPGTLSEAEAECAVKQALGGFHSDQMKPHVKVAKGIPAVDPLALAQDLKAAGVSWWTILRALPTILALVLPGTAVYADLLKKLLDMLHPVSKQEGPAPAAA